MRWIVQSRLRTAIAIICFITLFPVSVGFLLLGASAHGGSAPGGTYEAAPNVGGLVMIVGIVTSITSIIGTISTVILAWRADKRTAKESELKIVTLQQQLAELQSRSNTPSPS